MGFDLSHHRPLPTTTDRNDHYRCYGWEPNDQQGH